MNEDYFDKNAENDAATNASREGHEQQGREQDGFDKGDDRGPARPHRARFNSSARVGSSNYQGRRNFYPRNSYDDQAQRPYRPRTNYGENSYGQPRPRYNVNRTAYNGNRPSYDGNAEGGYTPRPRYGNAGQERRPYRPRFEQDGDRPTGGYQQGGYRTPNRGYDRSASPRSRFQPRDGYNRPAYGNRPGYDPHAKYSQKKRLEYKEEHYDPNEPIRLNKYLANAGVCSRRDADKYIEAGVVTVNGEVVKELGTKVLRTDEVKFHDTPVKIEKKVYVLLNKPKGYVTTSEDPQNRKTVMDLVSDACQERIYPVGRLDRNTTGVLLLTNDGELASKLTHPKFLKKKIYHVTCDKNVSAADMRQIAEGINLDDGDIRADDIEYASPTDKKQVGIEIHSGRNRIVRRIFESLGYHVVKLDRVYFAGLTKKNVRRGDWRYLTEKEVSMLRMGAFE